MRRIIKAFRQKCFLVYHRPQGGGGGDSELRAFVLSRMPELRYAGAEWCHEEEKLPYMCSVIHNNIKILFL